MSLRAESWFLQGGRSPYGERGLKSVSVGRKLLGRQSLSLRRAWIEIKSSSNGFQSSRRRSPYGERGLKSHDINHGATQLVSLSLRRAWIEMSYPTPRPRQDASLSLRRAWIEICRRGRYSGPSSGRSPYGERGLKSVWVNAYARRKRRSPYGERGLKYVRDLHGLLIACRSPYGERGLKLETWWIAGMTKWSLSLRRAWIEISAVHPIMPAEGSLSLRRAWIEIPCRWRTRPTP